MEGVNKVPDAELLHNLRTGNNIEESIRAIYRDHFDSLSWFVVNNSGNRQDAQDVFQEVVVSFIDVVKKDKFRGESSIKTFLFSLNKHIWLNELKKRGRAAQREKNYENRQEREEPDVSHLIAGREARNQMLALVERLDATCQKILVLFYYENKHIREILESLEYENEQVVRNKKYKCLKQLQQMIATDPSLRQLLNSMLNG